ncbi:hypothetical protein ACWC0A_30440 [Streptomyces scopuliridis]
MSNAIGTIWVCQDCMLHHANGECGSCNNGEHDKLPLLLINHPQHVAMGMAYAEHAEDCPNHFPLGADTTTASGILECDCETNTFSTSQCEGCGSYLHGERHAMTLFKN